MFNFSKVSRPALGTTQPPTMGLGFPSVGLRRPRNEAGHSPHLQPKLRMSEATPPIPLMVLWREQGQMNISCACDPNNQLEFFCSHVLGS